MIEKQVQEKLKHIGCVPRGKQGTNKTKKLRRIKTTSIDQIRQRTERENTGHTKFGRKKSLSLELIFLFLQKSKNSSPPKYPISISGGPCSKSSHFYVYQTCLASYVGNPIRRDLQWVVTTGFFIVMAINLSLGSTWGIKIPSRVDLFVLANSF